MPFDRARIAFGPEALSRFTQIIEEVTVDLVDDGLPAELMRSEEMRTRLAQRLLSFAHSWWTDTQIKQFTEGLTQRDLGLPNLLDSGGCSYQSRGHHSDDHPVRHQRWHSD